MLTRLHVENFKNWREADVRFGRITGLFGRNSSGKSSLIQFLLLLKQTREAADRAVALDLNGRLVQLGTMTDVIHGHDEGSNIRFELAFERLTELRIRDSASREEVAASRDVAVRATVESYRQAPRSRRLIYSVGDADFALKPPDDPGSGFALTATVAGRQFAFSRRRGRPGKLPRPVKTYRFPDQARTYYQNSGFLAELESAFESELDKVFYLGPLREHPQRDYLWSRSRPTDVGEKGEKTIDAIIAAQEGRERQNLKKRGRRQPFPEVIAHWLKELGVVYSFRVEEIAPGSNRWQAIVQTQPDGAEVMLTDVGFGVSQVLPVITLLHYVPEDSTVILEQPEIHLHPLAQAELADVIIRVATHRRVQVILESHSEHFLLRLQRRVAEAAISADDVSLYFCGGLDDTSKLELLQMDVLGRIANWPDKFMGDAFTETAEAELARLRVPRAAK